MTRIAYVSTYPPRRCGIASFTADLRRSVGDEGPVFASMRPHDRDDGADPAVVAHIRDDDPDSYRRSARLIDASDVEVVSLQHEFGIFGGPDGSLVLELLDRVRKPVAATMHTVLSRPSASQRAIVEAVGRRADAIVVMSRAAAAILSDVYDVATDIRVIPHGVPARRILRRDEEKAALGLGTRPVILSFGLVGPGKGYESAIDGMAAVRNRIPDALYVILGATHPDLVREHGESYRQSLEAQVRRAGLHDSVRFEDRFVGSRELDAWLAASDVFVTPYPNLDQIVSGTLAYALGAGRAIVSTPYLYAAEMLGDRGGGLLVPPGAPAALGQAIASILADPGYQSRLEARSLAAGDDMRWPRVGESYRELFRSLVPVSGRRSRSTVPVEVRA